MFNCIYIYVYRIYTIMIYYAFMYIYVTYAQYYSMLDIIKDVAF